MNDYRLTPREIREFEKYKDISDEEAELIIDDAVALARMILECIEDDLNR